MKEYFVDLSDFNFGAPNTEDLSINLKSLSIDVECVAGSPPRRSGASRRLVPKFRYHCRNRRRMLERYGRSLGLSRTVLRGKTLWSQGI